MTGCAPSGRVNIMSTDTKPPEPRETDAPRGSSRKDAALEALLHNTEALLRTVAAELAAVKRQAAEMHTDLRDLIDVVQAALPASLIQLSADSLERLIKDAPQTRLRLLAPFNSGMGTFQIGEEFLANDHRVRAHGRRMQLGLAPEHSDAPNRAVNKLVARQADRIAEMSRDGERRRLAEAAAAARAQADQLEAAAAS